MRTIKPKPDISGSCFMNRPEPLLFRTTGQGGYRFRCTFGHIPATLLRQSMRSSLIRYHHVATYCNRVARRVQHLVHNNINVALKCCVRLASCFTKSHNISQQCCDHLLGLTPCLPDALQLVDYCSRQDCFGIRVFLFLPNYSYPTSANQAERSFL